MCCLTEKIKKCFNSDFIQKQKQFMRFGVPTWLLSIIQVGLSFITVVFAGHIGNTMLVGVGLGNTIFNVLLWSVMWGFSSAMDTYGPQTYACPKRRERLGTVTLKISLQGLVVYIFILGIYLNFSHIVMLLPVEHATPPDSLSTNPRTGLSMVSGRRNNNSDWLDGNLSAEPLMRPLNNLEITVKYMNMVCLVPIFDFFVSILSKYLIIQQYIMEVYIISTIMVVVHLVSNGVLVWWLQWGLQGLVVSALLARILTLALIVFYCWCRRKELAWCGYTAEVCSDWRESLTLGLSGAANTFVELGMFEIATFLSQFNGTAALATVVIIFQILACCFTVPLGISTATTILIGNALGKESKSEIMSYMKISILNSLILAVFISLLFFLLRLQLGRLFTSDPEVLSLFTGCVWVFLIQIPFDHLQTVLSRGILISFGKQRFIALSLALICYLVGIPLIVVFIFCTSLGPLGIVIAFLVFAVLNTVSAAVKISTLSFDKELELSHARVVGTADEEICSSSLYSEPIDETTPLMDGKRKLTIEEKNVICSILSGLTFLGIMIYFSSLVKGES